MKLRKKICLKGTQFFLPPTLKCTKKNVHYFNVRFTDSCKYVLMKDGKPDPDQNDWLKLGGVSYAPTLRSRKNSVMVAWRWNPKQQVIEFAFYWHLEDKVKHYKTANVTAAPGDDIQFIIKDYSDVAEIILFNNTDLQVESFDISGIKTSKVKRVINPWFGGTAYAPHKVKLYFAYSGSKVNEVKGVETLNKELLSNLEIALNDENISNEPIDIEKFVTLDEAKKVDNLYKEVSSVMLRHIAGTDTKPVKVLVTPDLYAFLKDQYMVINGKEVEAYFNNQQIYINQPKSGYFEVHPIPKVFSRKLLKVAGIHSTEIKGEHHLDNGMVLVEKENVVMLKDKPVFKYNNIYELLIFLKGTETVEFTKETDPQFIILLLILELYG